MTPRGAATVARRAARAWARLRDERGSVLVITAIALTALVGMTSLSLDTGRYYVERRQLQNAVDAAALAAASYLPATDSTTLAAAQSAAITVAGENGVASGDLSVSVLSTAVADDTVQVSAAGSVNFAFARALGIDTGTLHASATVQLGSLSAISGVLPFGVAVPPGGLAFGQTYCLKLSSGGQDNSCENAHQGNFQALDIDNTGNDSASEYRDRIASGSLTTVGVGEQIGVTSGNMSGPTKQGLSDRFNGNTQTFDDVVAQDAGGYRVLDWTSPRLAVLPLVTYSDNSHAVVQGFGLFFINGCDSNGSVSGRYVNTIVRGGQWGPYQPGTGSYEAKITQ